MIGGRSRHRHRHRHRHRPRPRLRHRLFYPPTYPTTAKAKLRKWELARRPAIAAASPTTACRSPYSASPSSNWTAPPSVARTAAMWELKIAIEDVFSRASYDGEWIISWCHVWGHFCLCYKDRKLTDEKAYLRSFGIKDGDQLHFVRHLTINYNPRKRRSKSLETVFEVHRRSLAEPEVSFKKEDYPDTNEDHRRSTSCIDQQDIVHNGNDNINDQIEFKLGKFFRGWFSYSKLVRSKKMHSERKTISLKSSKKSVRSKLGHWLSKKSTKVEAK